MAIQIAVYNGAMPTTSVFLKQPTGAGALRTQLQVALVSTMVCKVIEWGVSLDGSAAATPGTWELIETDVAATMTTAIATADMMKFGDTTVGASTTFLQSGTALTGFASAAVTEGTTTATRVFDAQLIPPTGQYIKQWPLGREPYFINGKFYRIRSNTPAAVNCICYVVLEF